MTDAPLDVSEKKTQMKTAMSDEERIALCQKLDEQLDDFINSMERKQYTDGWTEDNWEVISLHVFQSQQVSDYFKTPHELSSSMNLKRFQISSL